MTKLQWTKTNTGTCLRDLDTDVVYARIVLVNESTAKVEMFGKDGEKLDERKVVVDGFGGEKSTSQRARESAMHWLVFTHEVLSFTDCDFKRPVGYNPGPGERWHCGFSHDPRSEEMYDAISTYDFEQNGDFFGFSSGGDGDNGECLMYLMDMYFEERGQE